MTTSGCPKSSIILVTGGTGEKVSRQLESCHTTLSPECSPPSPSLFCLSLPRLQRLRRKSSHWDFTPSTRWTLCSIYIAVNLSHRKVDGTLQPEVWKSSNLRTTCRASRTSRSLWWGCWRWVQKRNWSFMEVSLISRQPLLLRPPRCFGHNRLGVSDSIFRTFSQPTCLSSFQASGIFAGLSSTRAFNQTGNSHLGWVGCWRRQCCLLPTSHRWND